MATRFDPSNIDVKTGKAKVKPQVIIGVNTKAEDYKQPKAEKQVAIVAKKPVKVAPKAAPKAVATTSKGEAIREAITATKRREQEAGLN